MKKSLKPSLRGTYILILFLFIMSATSSEMAPVLKAAENGGGIILYGNEKCGYCRETRRWLDDNGIPYTYRDVELYGTFQEEMYRKLSGAGTARFPVLDVKGQMLIRPTGEEIQRALRGEKVTRSEERKLKSPMWRPEKKRSLEVSFDTVKPSLKESDLILYTDGGAESKKVAALLKKQNIPFTLRELNLMGNAAFFDLSSRLADRGYGNTVYFPVAEVRGELIMKASVEDIRILIIEATGAEPTEGNSAAEN